ncbi:protein SRG1-like isoform X2 [Lolium rigidum]|uniref:protein SRG1-like isoform X2 n=1 Tax=Lolium rigidum TaxID=89674 RepID=UPI001F5C123B|nr:protein SRG1-like isoform X2 [Lolium rigidum]
MADAEPWKTVTIPPIVQELVTSVQEPPSRYVIPEQNRAALAGSEMLDPIPIIDLSRLSSNADEVSKLRSALENWGLFLAVGHGMEPGFLGEVMKVTRDFFKLPLEEKQKYSNLVNGNEVRIEGYGNDMVVSEKQILDWCDRLYIIVEPESRRINSLWPTQPPSFRCRNIANLFLENLAKLLNLREDYFVDMFDEDSLTYARFNYYPHCPKPDHVLGMKPHTDASVITIVFIDDNVSGLQLQNNGVWYDVPIVPNTLLVNVGDVMEIMSNGFFKSPVHRVVTNAEKERLSLVMFYTMGPEREIEPLSELVDEKTPVRYRKIKTNDYIATLFETFARGTLAIDAVKI